MMRNVLNIIDKIYSSEYFTTALVIAIVILMVLFTLVFIMGMIDNKKEELKKLKEIEDEQQDINYSEIKEEDKIKEDITFEYPSITKNLEAFKTSLEQELNQEKDSFLPLEKSQKPYRVLNVSELEDTTVIPTMTADDLEKTLILPRMKSDQIKVEENNADPNGEGSDYLKQNIFSSAK